MSLKSRLNQIERALRAKPVSSPSSAAELLRLATDDELDQLECIMGAASRRMPAKGSTTRRWVNYTTAEEKHRYLAISRLLAERRQSAEGKCHVTESAAPAS